MKLTRNLMIVFIMGLIVSIAVDFWLFGVDYEGKYPWSRLWGFYALFGFVSCILIIIVSKWLGQYFLQRDEDYYQKGLSCTNYGQADGNQYDVTE